MSPIPHRLVETQKEQNRENLISKANNTCTVNIQSVTSYQLIYISRIKTILTREMQCLLGILLVLFHFLPMLLKMGWNKDSFDKGNATPCLVGLSLSRDSFQSRSSNRSDSF